MKLCSQTARYVLATFVFTWSLWLLGYWLRGRVVYFRMGDARIDLPLFDLFVRVSAFGPGIIALFMAGEKEDWGSLWARLANWRVDQMWYSIAFFLPVGIVSTAIFCYVAAGGQLYVLASSEHLVLFFSHLLLAAFFEELGWRGYLLPTLLERRRPMQATMMTGAIWGLWHFPARWNEASGQLPVFIVFFVTYCFLVAGFSVVFTWLFFRTRGALLPAVVLHATYNVLASFVVDPAIREQDLRLALWLAVVMWTTAFIIHRLGGLRRPDDAAPLPTASP